MENLTFRRTSTSDSGADVQVVNIKGAMPVSLPAGVFLHHITEPFWCGAGGEWLEERTRAVRFATNIDGLIYCQALGVRGLLVAFDADGREIYQLNVNLILDAVAVDPFLLGFFGSQP